MKKSTRLWLLAALGGLSFSGSAFAAKAPRIAPLRVLESYTLPAVEISGMAWRLNPKTQRRELVLVGDRDRKVLVVDWARRHEKLSVEVHDLSADVQGESATQSEWESIYSDETGRLFIIQESPAQILVVSQDLKRIESRMDLVLPAAAIESLKWDLDLNARAEGLLLLKNGHVLVVKEKAPLRVLEFGPKDSGAAGYQAGLSIEKKGSFPIAAPLHYLRDWAFSPEHETLFEDSSELSLDSKGSLYLLGDQRNLIGLIGKSLKPNRSKIKLSRLWSLPSEIKQPEGMVIDDEGRPIIAIDHKKTKNPNLFLLSPMK